MIRHRGDLFQSRAGYAFISPAFLVLVLMVVYPLIYGIVISFFDTNLVNKFDFVGLKYYGRLIKDTSFYASLGRTVMFTFFTVLGRTILAVLFANILVMDNLPYKKAFRAILVLPWFFPDVVVGMLWRWLYNANYGLFNFILRSLGIIDGPIEWLSNTDTVMWAVILVSIWKGFPFFAISFLAGLQSISSDLYEAAEIDGAGKWRRFLTVTIPGLKPVIITTTVLRLIWTANTTDLIFTMTTGGPGYSTHVLALYTYLTAWTDLDFGYSSAMAIFLMLVLLIFIGIYMKLINKDKENDII